MKALTLADLIPLCDKEPPFFIFYFGRRKRATSEDKVLPRFSRNLPSFLPCCFLPTALSYKREQREAPGRQTWCAWYKKKEICVMSSTSAPPFFFLLQLLTEDCEQQTTSLEGKKPHKPCGEKRVEEGNLWGEKTGSVWLFVTRVQLKYIYTPDHLV